MGYRVKMIYWVSTQKWLFCSRETDDTPWDLLGTLFPDTPQ